MLLDYICKRYEPGQPIFVEDIVIENMSEKDKQEQLNRLLTYCKLCQFDAETYFLPRLSLTNQGDKISPDVVAREKYIYRGKEKNRLFLRIYLGKSLGESRRKNLKNSLRH